MWDMHNHTTPEQVERNRMSLYANMNKRKKAGTSRSASESTVSDAAYANMKAGFPKSKTDKYKKKKA